MPAAVDGVLVLVVLVAPCVVVAVPAGPHGFGSVSVFSTPARWLRDAKQSIF